MRELRVFLADDSDLIRQQVERAFSRIDGLNLIGTAPGTSEATSQIKSLQPDIVVLDISMPHREGIQVLREIRREVPRAEIVIFTADSSLILKDVCLESGADFYLDKTQLQDLIDLCTAQQVAS